MPSDYGGVACPKPEPRKRVKGRRQRHSSTVEQKVRAAVSARDGDCRVLTATPLFGYCGGESEWAHLEDKRRFKTRGQAPEVRHTTAGSLMLCTRHHQMYDAHYLRIDPHTPRGADGPLHFIWASVTTKSYLEPEKVA